MTPYGDMMKDKEYHKQYRALHREKALAYARQYNLTHQVEARAYRLNHRVRLRLQMRKYHETHRAKMRTLQHEYYRTHKQSRGEYNRRYRTAHKEQIRANLRVNHLKRKFGLTTERYRSLLAQQNASCGICGLSFIRTPDVDHDHLTKNVRGLLCRQCNLGIALFKENIGLLQKAIAYVNHPPIQMEMRSQ